MAFTMEHNMKIRNEKKENTWFTVLLIWSAACMLWGMFMREFARFIAKWWCIWLGT